MFIQTEETPNPATLKFIPEDIILLEKDTAEFKNVQQAKEQSPLAYELFKIKGVSAIFFGRNFITVTKENTVDWKIIKPEILASLMDFFLSKQPIMHQINNSADQDDSQDSEIVKQIKELIEIKVRPSVAMDGGDIIYRGFEDGIVKLQLKGSCSGCPSSTITLKNGIENMLKHYIPEVEGVEQIMEDEE